MRKKTNISADSQSPAESQSLAESQRRKAYFDALLSEIKYEEGQFKLQVLKGQYVDRDKAERLYEHLIITLKSELMSLPPELISKISNMQDHNGISKAIMGHITGAMKSTHKIVSKTEEEENN